MSPLFIFKCLKTALNKDLKKRQVKNREMRKMRFNGKLTIRASIEGELLS